MPYPGPGPLPEGGGADPSPPSAGSILVQGSSRPLVNLLLYALAEHEPVGFHWLDVRARDEPAPPADPVLLGWIPAERLWSVDPSSGLAPDHARVNAALFELVRDDEPPATLARLIEFLGLPPTLQRILAEMQRPDGGGVLAVANVDRIADAFAGEVIPPILHALQRYGCSLYAGSCRPSPTVVPGFDRVLRIEGGSLHDLAAVRVTLKGGPPYAGLQLDTPVSVEQVPFVARVFASAGADAGSG